MNTKIANYTELADGINARMRDEKLRQLIFDAKQVKKLNREAYLGKITKLKRIAEIAYLLIYIKWSSCPSIDNITLSAHGQNVFNLLGRVYKSEPLCLDAIIYTLTEAKRDVAELGKKSFFAEVITDCDCRYGRICDWIHRARGMDRTLDDVRADLIFDSTVSILDSVGWFENVEFFMQDNALSFKLGGKEYPCGDYFCNINGKLCLLASYELVEYDTARCKYVYFGSLSRENETLTIDKKRSM